MQTYHFDSIQACKVEPDDTVMFTHDLDIKFKATAVDLSNGKLKLKIGQKGLIELVQAVPRAPLGSTRLAFRYRRNGI